jgi:hypothetical protein
MRRNQWFLIIGLGVLAAITGGIILLNGLKEEISKNHVNVTFEVHNYSNVNDKVAFCNNTLGPLLTSFSYTKGNSKLEHNYFFAVRSGEHSFCIPASGINVIRYDSEDLSMYTSATRQEDEASFFESWDGGEKLGLVIKSIMKGQKNINAPSIETIKKQSKNTFIDSFIIDPNFTGGENYRPFVFNNASDLKVFVNDQIKQFQPKKHQDIHVFICSLNESIPTPAEPTIDTDGDGVPDKNDQCVEKPGDPKCGGCPCPPVGKCPQGDRDRDGICDDKDACPDKYGKARYKGCPIPDSDGDGWNDEIDKCPYVPSNDNRGCPTAPPPPNPTTTPIIGISLSNLKINVSGLSKELLSNGYYVKLKIKQKDGNVKSFNIKSSICPSSNNEGYSILNALKYTSDLTLEFELWKNDNKEKDLNFSFRNVSFICSSSNSCGFKQW